MSKYPNYKILEIIEKSDNWFALFIDSNYKITKKRILFFAKCRFFDGFDDRGFEHHYQTEDEEMKIKLIDSFIKDELVTNSISEENFSDVYEYTMGFISYFDNLDVHEIIFAPDYENDNFTGYYHKDDIEENIKNILEGYNKDDHK